MQRSEATEVLKRLILIKEAGHKAEGQLLKEHFRLTYESLRPVNLIKNALREVVSAPEVKTNLVSSAIGLAAGFLVKKLFTRNAGPLAKIAGSFIETFVANKVANNADGIKAIGSLLFAKITAPPAKPGKTG